MTKKTIKIIGLLLTTLLITACNSVNDPFNDNSLTDSQKYAIASDMLATSGNIVADLIESEAIHKSDAKLFFDIYFKTDKLLTSIRAAIDTQQPVTVWDVLDSMFDTLIAEQHLLERSVR
jgi:hypothetical protein